MDRASSSSLFRYVRVHFATFKSHARTSLREVVVDPIAGDTLGEKTVEESGRKYSKVVSEHEHSNVAKPAVHQVYFHEPGTVLARMRQH